MSYTASREKGFSEILDTTISYDFLNSIVWDCNNLLKWKLSRDQIILAVQCKGRLFRLIEWMRELEKSNNWLFDEEDIQHFNTEYNEINELMSLLKKENELVEVMPTIILQLPYKERVIENITPGHSGAKILPFVHERVSPHNRIRALQNSIFGTHWEILPAKAIDKIREKIAKILSTDPVSANLYKWDCLAANDEKFPDAEISVDMIIRAIKTAKIRKDGAFVQSIKNNLIHKAQELEKQTKPNIEKSLLLADHIKNLTPKNPITMNTVTFGKCWITNVITIEHGDDARYGLDILLKNGNKKHITILASSCAVGDLSNIILIRNIESIIPITKPEITTIKDHTTNFIRKWFGEIKNMFGFGKKTRN